MACTRRSNMMIHEAWSHFQGIWYALGIWISEDDWLCKDLEHDVWEIDDLQHFTLRDARIMLPHVPFIQIPWQSTRRSRHFRLHRATAGSFQWPNLAVAASHPTAGQDQQCLSVWTWIKLNRKLQSPTLYNVLCLRNNVKNQWGQLNSYCSFWGGKYGKHTNSLTWDTVTSQIQLLECLCCLIQQRFCNGCCCIMQSAILHLYIPSSTSKQCKCIPVPQQGSTQPPPQQQQPQKKNDNNCLFENIFVAGFKDTTRLLNIVSIVCQGKGNCSRNWKQQSKNAIKGQPANLKTGTENTQSIPTTLWAHTTCTIASWFVSGVPFTAMCVSLV